MNTPVALQQQTSERWVEAIRILQGPWGSQMRGAMGLYIYWKSCEGTDLEYLSQIPLEVFELLNIGVVSGKHPHDRSNHIYSMLVDDYGLHGEPYDSWKYEVNEITDSYCW